jgi:hypothetical protein
LGHACPVSGAPACSAGACYACSATNVSQCSGTTPACNTATHACAACNGDFGSAASQACVDAQQPACVATGACVECGVVDVPTTYYVNALAAANVGADGSTNMTALVDRTANNGNTNENRAITNNTLPTGTTRYRVNLNATGTATNQEFMRAYTPVYATATLVAANATAYADFYLRTAGAAGTTLTAWARLYEYNDTTGIAGAAKGTASLPNAPADTGTTTRQTLNGSFGNAAFTVAAGNRLLVIYGFDIPSSCRPAYLWGQGPSGTPSGYQSFTVSVPTAHAQACPSGTCTASNTCATPCNGDRGSGTANACTSLATPACVSGACVPCSSTNATACTVAQVCDTVLNRCVQCTDTDASKCTGTTPICNAATNTCVACNGDLGSTATFACSSAAAPICSAGACVACANNRGGAAPACSLATEPACVSGQCLQCSTTSTSACSGSTPVCDAALHQCRPCDGSYGGGSSLACAGATSPVCVSGACAPCTGNFGGGAGSCASATMPACLPSGACVQCSTGDTALCAGATPICDEASSTCVACDGAYASGTTHACTDFAKPQCVSGACVQCASGADCANPTPICDATSRACGACNGDDGTATSRACPAASPTCSSTGCRPCTANSDCTFAGATHTGAVCNTVSGRCIQCGIDADCPGGGTQWCNASLCVAKIANGLALPGTCAALGARACLSGVCESDNLCGYANAPASTNPCSGDAGKCRSGKCDPTDNRCGLTNGQGACAAASAANDCRSGACDASSAKCGSGNGTACTLASQCASLSCVDTVCCNSACSGSCDSCNLSGSVGTCAFVADGDSGSPSCTPYVCDGAGAACPGTCLTDLDCAAGNWCDGTGHCGPKNGNGTLCGGGHECLTGECVDGVCCNTACNGACDACNLSGTVGSCTLATGTSGSPSCGAYLCGGAASCPTTCTLTTQCTTGFFCDGTGHCVSKGGQGDPCGASGECANGRCVDGYCCDAPCAGQCEACNVTGNLGTCSPFDGAPRNGRPACAGAGATCEGSCAASERLACTYPTFQCSPAACDGTTGTETHLAQCDGAGACPAATTKACSPYVCGATACLGSCSTSADCAAGFWCDATSKCAPLLVVGDACTAPASCPGNLCVDGFCCAGACPGQCEACNVSGHEGACWPVTGAPHAGRAACVTAAAACAGACNGANAAACVYPDNATSCGSPTCAAGTATAGACDALGGCATTSTPCSPFVCDAAACKTACAADGECAAGFWCDAPNCVAQVADGKSCSGGQECLSGHCVDGLCCDTACAGQCEACDLPAAKGTCSAVLGAPRGSRPACFGAGACAGVCDGRQTLSCAFPDGSIECRAGSCTAEVATLPAGCDGAGACSAVQTVACAPFHCGTSQCVGDCAVDSDCAAGSYCAGGLCKPRLAGGTPCSADAQCASDHCTDGVCCDLACAGQCEACNLTGKVGVCSPVTGAPAGGRIACASDGSACGGECDGAERLSCAYPASETSCRAAACAAGVATLAASCDGAGACPLPQTIACAPNPCSGAGCGGAGCVVDSDCPAGSYCAAGICQPKLDPGDPCSSPSQCASSHCVDSVCCDGVCGGQCEACNVAGKVGTCSPVAGSPRGARTSCADDGTACAGLCDGILATACAYPDTSVECRAASCAGGVAIVPASCDGLGACPPFSVRLCDPLACAGEVCSGGCTSDGECAAGYFCSAGKCEPKKPVGGSCGRAPECTGGLCVDGFCCNRACDAQCEACDATGSEGTCSPVSGIPHGGRAGCAGQGACQGRCDGTAAAACAYPGASTTCADTSCEAGLFHETSHCSGAGECTAGAATTCTSGACQGPSCSCSGPGECAAGLVCLGGACVVEPPDAGAVPPDASIVVPPDATVVVPPDATVVIPPDAQVVAPDAESPGPDAEVVLPDAEVALPDAEAPGPDAAIAVADAAAPGLDASQPGRDAGVPDGAFGEGLALSGGCACGFGAGASASPLTLLGLAMAGLWLRRRRG